MSDVKEVLRVVDVFDNIHSQKIIGCPFFLMGHFHHKEAHVLGGVPYVMSSNMDVQDEVPSYLRVSLGDGVDYEYKNLY